MWTAHHLPAVSNLFPAFHSHSRTASREHTLMTQISFSRNTLLRQQNAQLFRKPRSRPTTSNCIGATGEAQSKTSKKADFDPLYEFGFLSDFAERYELGEKIGAGGFGIVHVAVDKATGKRYAVKTLPKRFESNGQLQGPFADRVRREVDIYDHLGRSLNVVYLYGAYEDDTCVDLLMELCTGGQLWHRITKGSYSERDAAVIIREMVRIVAQCHAKNVLIRDVKPENFLFLNSDENSPLKAIDFGSAIYLRPGQKLKDKAGSPMYLAPEVLRQSYGLPADVWSTGIVAYLLLTGTLPFKGEEGEEVAQEYMTRYNISSTKDVFRAILYAPLDFESHPWDVLSPDARDFVSSLLQRDPDSRPTAEEAFRHRWLQMEEHPARSLSDTTVQRLQRFGTFGRFKQIAMRVLSRSIARDDQKLVAELTHMFSGLDGNGTGKLHADVIRQGLQDPRFDLTELEIDQLMEDFDTDAEGQVSYESWLAAMMDWKEVESRLDWDRWVATAFNALHADGDDVISRDDLALLLCPQEECAADTVEAALREADSNGDGSIDLQDFKQFLHTSSSDDLEIFETRLVSDHEHSAK